MSGKSKQVDLDSLTKRLQQLSAADVQAAQNKPDVADLTRKLDQLLSDLASQREKQPPSHAPATKPAAERAEAERVLYSAPAQITDEELSGLQSSGDGRQAVAVSAAAGGQSKPKPIPLSRHAHAHPRSVHGPNLAPSSPLAAAHSALWDTGDSHSFPSSLPPLTAPQCTPIASPTLVGSPSARYRSFPAPLAPPPSVAGSAIASPVGFSHSTWGGRLTGNATATPGSGSLRSYLSLHPDELDEEEADGERAESGKREPTTSAVESSEGSSPAVGSLVRSAGAGLSK